VNSGTKTSRVVGLLLFTFLLLTQWLLSDVVLADATKKTESVKNNETTIKKYQDWVYQCGGEGLNDNQCYISQNIFIQESDLRLLGVAVGYLGPDDLPWLFFTLPLGIYLPAGMVFQIDGGDENKLPIRICLADGCKSSIGLDKKLLNALKKGNKAKVAFLDGNSRKQITVEVSLAGFSRSFAAL
jgi:invasion protein IalB